MRYELPTAALTLLDDERICLRDAGIHGYRDREWIAIEDTHHSEQPLRRLYWAAV